VLKVKLDKTKLKVLEKVGKQARYAAMVALTRSAKAAQEAIKKEMPQVFSNPTPYTRNSLRVKPAKKTDLQAAVLFKDSGKGNSAGDYLRPQIYGGSRRQTRMEYWFRMRGLISASEFLVPGRDAPRNKYGNLRPGIYPKIMSQLQLGADRYMWSSDSARSKRNVKKSGTYFWSTGVTHLGNRGLPRGLYLRKGKKLTIIMIPVSSVNYSKRFRFHTVGQRKVREVFRGEFGKAFAEAMRTAR
jgi:hypothetical protein